MMCQRIVLAVLCLAWGAVAVAADKAPESINSRLMPAFEEMADNTPMKLAWNATTIDEHNAWHEAFRAKMVELLGRMPDRVPLEVRWAEKKEFDKFVRHKVYIRTEENYWSPNYYFVPKNVKGRVPAIVCLHGHKGIWPYIRDGNKYDLQTAKKANTDYAVYLAEHGYVTLAQVIRGWNETAADGDYKNKPTKKQSCRRVTMDALMLGMTPMGLRCWDAMRAIDFLQAQPEVDAERIGVAGLSGGGTLSMYLPILDPRVKLAMIAGAFSTYRAAIFSSHCTHCICNCLPHIMQWGEMGDVVGLQSPRPVLIIGGIKDHIFPIKEARQQFERLEQIYKLLGASDNLESDFFDGPHAWSNNKTLPFLKKHFGKKPDNK